MKLLLKYLKPHILTIVTIVVLLFVQAFTNLSLPNLMSEMINVVVQRTSHAVGSPEYAVFHENQMSQIMSLGLKMIAITIVCLIVTLAVNFISARLGALVAKNLRHDIFKKILDFSNAEYGKFSTSSLLTRTTNDVEQVKTVIVFGIRFLCYSPIMGIGGVIMAIEKSVSMTWIIALSVIVLLGFMSVIFGISMPKFKIMQTLTDKLNLITRENLTGLMVIRSFNNENREYERFEECNTETKNVNRFVQRVMGGMMPLMTLIMNFTTLAILWVGADYINRSLIQVGDMMAFMQYTMQIIMSFLMITMSFMMLPRASVSLERIGAVLNTENTITDTETPTYSKISGEIEFKNVSFKYPDAKNYMLHNVSFKANKGDTIAIIGSTGSGKSTLINLIPRFFDSTDGEVLIDGVNVKEYTQEFLRDNIGFIPQKRQLFSGTVESNMKFAKADATLEEIDEALEIAQAKEFVYEHNDGLNRAVEQGGSNFSGGQRQRLAIARALIKKAPIYIFDDSFSALDYETDSRLRKMLKEKASDSTMVIVAQRISSIIDSDQIIVLNNGEIVGIGKHDELSKSCKTYIEIMNSQLSVEEVANGGNYES